MNKLEKKLMGHIGVDSGTVYIGDPCYLRTETNPDEISHAIQSAWEEGKYYKSINYGLGHEGCGIVSSTYDGDGTYPVYGYFEDNHDRPAKIVIDFAGSEE